MASKFEVFNGNADNEKILRIGTSSHCNDFESLVNNIVVFSSLRESGGLEEPNHKQPPASVQIGFLHTKGSARKCSLFHHEVETTKAISVVFGLKLNS